MRNRMLFIGAGALLFSGCSLLQKKTENKTSQLSEVNTGTQKSNVEVDNSNLQSSEKWKLTVPGISSAKLNDFQSKPLPDMTGMTEDQKRSFLDLRGLVSDLYNNQRNSTGWTLEWEKSIKDQLAKLSSSQSKDTSSTKNKNKADLTVREPLKIPWLYIILGAAAAGLIGGLIPKLFPMIIKKIFNR